MRLNCLALAQGAKKPLKHVNGVLLDSRRGAFGKSVRRKLKKNNVFKGQEALFPEVSLAKWRALGPEAKKEEGSKLEMQSHAFYNRESQKRGQNELFYWDLRS